MYSHNMVGSIFEESCVVQVKQEGWWLYIADKKRKEMVVFPQKVSGLKTVLTQDLQFQAPDRPCVLRYVVILTSDSYLNLQFTAELKVCRNILYSNVRDVM